MTFVFPCDPLSVEQASGPLVSVRLDTAGDPMGATAVKRIRADREKVWRTITDVQGMAKRVPMIDRVKQEGRFVTVHLRFGVSLFSANFAVKVEQVVDEGKSLELRYVSGEPKGLLIRYDVTEAREAGCSLLCATVEFDVYSVGFMAKVFLKHHPEIRYGVYPGSALALMESVRKAVE
jgi:ribosome-associated toxin RatA of RatAB toxin-antitoxin module